MKWWHQLLKLETYTLWMPETPSLHHMRNYLRYWEMMPIMTKILNQQTKNFIQILKYNKTALLLHGYRANFIHILEYNKNALLLQRYTETKAFIYLLPMQLCIFKKLPESFLPLFQPAVLLAAFLLCTLLYVLLKYLFTFLWSQKQVAWVEDNLVKLLFPGREGRHLKSTQQLF